MNLKRFRQNFQMDHTVYVPQIYSQHSTPKVITMDLIQGQKVSEVTEADGYHLKLIAKRGALSYFKQVVEDGFFHADPHPSNIYILKGDVLCYLDFGMMGVLDEDFRQDLAELFIYLMDTNVKGTISKLQQMGIIDEHVDTRSLKYDLIDLLFKYYGTELSEVHGGLDDLLRLMRKYQATLPRELVLLARGIGMVEEMGRNLDPTFNAVEIAQPLVRKIARKRLSP